jgi:uncharacterized protein
MAMATIKRFIAGAVCPKCGAMDRLVIFNEDGKQFRECVNCDFADEMKLSYPGRELTTRVNRTEEEKNSEISPVKLIDP